MESLAVTDLNLLDLKFWRDKRVLLTGHTGFKGSWLTLWLNRLGAKVTGVSLPPNSSPSLFHLANVEKICTNHFCDIRDAAQVAAFIKQAQPEIVFHLAAQPLVRASYRDPIGTLSTNVMGTAHVLEALRGSDTAKIAVMITTDKVYRNNEWLWPYREDDALGGHDPYSASKAACELVISSYRDSYLSEQGLAVASARAGNIMGGGDWSEDRLIPDAVRAWGAGEVLEIRRPASVRPWQHVLDPLAGYLGLAQRLWDEPSLRGAFNFGPEPGGAATVRQVAELARTAYGAGEVHFNERHDNPHEAGLLTLEIAKAQFLLGFKPLWPLQEAIARTMHWYRDQYNGEDSRALCEADIAAYEGML